MRKEKIFKFFELLLILLLINVTTTLTAGSKLPAPFKVIPEPAQIEINDGSTLLYQNVYAIYLRGIRQPPVMGHLLSRLVDSDKEGKGVITLSLSNSESLPDTPEGYTLLIADGSVVIDSKGQAGLFYGCQTLEQLLEDACDTNTPLPACKITDYPAYSFRAVHFDVKHHLDHSKYYYDSIDRLAQYKINGIVFEFEDKLRYKRRPLVSAPQAISIDEMKALTAYARQRYIEINPLVQGLGHATFILKHQEYKHLRELEDNHWAFCPMDEGTYEVLFDLYLDAMEATPDARYLHVGGDEIGNIGLCHRCKDFADKEGLLALNLYWLKRVCNFVEEHGRIPIFWDDMPFKYAGLWRSVHSGQDITEEETVKIWEEGLPKLNNMVDKFPSNAVHMNWNYRLSRYPGNYRALDWYRDQGRKVMIATSTQTTTPLMPSGDRVEVIKMFNELAYEYKIDGVLCTAWDDSSPHMETYWRGFIAAAEYSWAPNKKNVDEYHRAFLQREFGPECVNYEELFEELYKTSEFWDESLHRSGNRKDSGNALSEFPDLNKLPKPTNNKNKKEINYRERLIELPDLKEPGSWSKKYKERLKKSKIEIDRYQKTSKQLKELIKKSRRNRFHWEIFSTINDFQATAPHLLLALQTCDHNEHSQQKTGFEQVRNVMVKFESAWAHLEDAFAKTRFISYPEDYQPDHYFHYASQREDISFMKQAEELYHEMIREWLANNNVN
jgi:hexosaminidase